jgi:hypothetical protein
MESYIVRLYRQADAGGTVVGTVEAAGTGQRKIIHSREELLAALVAVPAAGRRRTRAVVGKR